MTTVLRTLLSLIAGLTIVGLTVWALMQVHLAGGP